MAAQPTVVSYSSPCPHFSEHTPLLTAHHHLWRLFLMALPAFLAVTLMEVAPAHAWEALVVRVVDGDTIIVSPDGVATPDLLGVSVRLYGIDAPEMSQTGGKAAKAALEQLAQPGDTVEILTMESDKYDRLVGVLTHKGIILNVEMLRSGHALLYKKYCRASFCREWENIE